MLKSFRPGEIWPDQNGVHINAHGGGILDYEGKYFWFGEHKIAGGLGNSAQTGVHCYSSTDLYNWKDEGIALAVSDDPLSEITRGCVIERPKVVYNRMTHNFVMWFHLELKDKGYSAARSGVAIGETPAGPYKFLWSFRPNAGIWPMNVRPEQKAPVDRKLFEGRTFNGGYEEDIHKYNILGRDFHDGQMARDMTLFTDSFGSVYHIYTSEENSTLHISMLGEDYISLSGKYARAFEGRYMEAPAVCKRMGKYYFIGSDCTGWMPNEARSAVSDSIWGPWKELGNPCVGEGSEKTFGGQSTFILKVRDREDAYIAMFDLWRPENPIDGRYMWLPIQFKEDRMVIEYLKEWDLSFFDK